MVTKTDTKIEIVRGELTHKEEKLSEKSKKVYWLLEIYGVGKAASWEKKVADALQVGKSYEYETEYDGQYRTVRSVKDAQAQAPQPQPPAPPQEHQVGYIPGQKDTQAIMAQVALKSAVERANGILGREIPTSEIILMGQEYLLAMKAWSIGKLVNPEPVSVKVDRPVKTEPPSTTTKQPEATPEGNQELPDRLPTLNPDWVKAVHQALTALGRPEKDHDSIVFKRFGAKTVASLTMDEANLIIAAKPRAQTKQPEFEEL